MDSEIEFIIQPKLTINKDDNTCFDISKYSIKKTYADGSIGIINVDKQTIKGE